MTGVSGATPHPRRTLVVISAGLSQPSSTRLLADRLTAAVQARAEGETEVQVIELRDLAHDITNNLLTGFAAPKLQAAIDALTGADRALTDIGAAIAVLRRRPDIDPGPLLIGGQSRGGALSIAYAGAHPENTFGVINFVVGWLDESCSVAESVNQTLFERGVPFNRSTIWLYGQDDHYYSMAHSKSNFAAFEKAGGRGKFVAFDTPSDIGHNVIHYPDRWGGPIGDYLSSLSGKR